MASEEQIHNAEQDYLSGMKYKDLATKYNVTMNTIKSWRKRHGWTREKGAPKTEKRVHPKTKGAPQKIVDELEANGELNDKQKLFCLFYLQSFNATKAYQRAYDVDYETANRAGSRLLANDGIRGELTRLKRIRQEAEALTAEDVLHELKRQAFADVGDYVDFYTHDEQLIAMYGPMLDDNKEPVVQKRSRIYLSNKEDVDTSLIKSVKVGKDGVDVELFDKQKALELLLKHLEPETESHVRKAKADAEISEAKAKLLSGKGTERKAKIDKYLDELGALLDEDD